MGSRKAMRVMSPWRRPLRLFAALVVLLVLVYGDTLLSMVNTWWRSETFAHGFLVLPISIYLVWRRRERLRMLAPSITLPAIPLLLLLVLLWLLAHLADVLVVQQLAVVSMLPVLVLLVFGREVFRCLLFPLLYLYFMVPFGEFLIPRLQDITAYIAVNALRLSGVPVFWEGLYFSIPSGTFEVAEACSGIRYLIASLALGTLYAYLTYESLFKRVLFVLLSIAVPILANGLRAYGIVMLADLSDYQLATGVDHLIYGWLFFGIVMVLLFWLGSRFRDVKDTSRLMNERREEPLPRVPSSSGHLAATGLAAALALLSGPLLVFQLRPAETPYFVQVDLPERLPGFEHGADIAPPAWAPGNEGAIRRLARRYEGAGGRIELYVAAYGSQHQGKEMVRINGRYLPKPWIRSVEKIENYTLVNGREARIRHLVAHHGERNVTIFQEFYVDGRYTTQPVEAKLWETISALEGRSTVSAIIMFSVAAHHRATDSDLATVMSSVLSALHGELGLSATSAVQGGGR